MHDTKLIKMWENNHKKKKTKKQLKYGGPSDVVTSCGKPFIVIGAFFDFDDCQHFSRLHAMLKVVVQRWRRRSRKPLKRLTAQRIN